MLKFLRKYEKWMLVIFCAVLMVAFTAMPVMKLFMPSQGKKTLATTIGGEKITQINLQETSRDLQQIRRLGMEPFPAFPLLPSTGQDGHDALSWMLIQRAAKLNNLQASDQQAFNLVAQLVGADNMDALEDKANEMGANAHYLIGLGKQYLLAEQLRQIVSGIEYTKPGEDEKASGSPGMRRLVAASAASKYLQQQTSNPQFQMQMQFAQMQGISPDMLLLNMLQQQGFVGRINGHARVTTDEIRYILQRGLAEVDITVALLDAAKRAEDVTVDDAYVQSIFDRYAADNPGTGEPYRLGYRVPPRVKLQALRIPIDAAREAVAKDISPEDIRTFYEDHRSSFIDPAALTEDGQPKPQRLTAQNRDEIRTILTQINASQKVGQIAQQIRQRLNEDARGLEDDGPFKKLPDDFSPTPLVQIASQIKQEHGIEPELITIDQWTSSRDIETSRQFTETWVNELPTAKLRLPNPNAGGMLVEVPIQQAALGGKTGLFTAQVPIMNQGRQQGLGLAAYISFAKPFVEIDSPGATMGLQPKLPGQVLVDSTGSTYVMRITEADPSHPAPQLGPIAEKVRADAKKIKAYEALVKQKQALLTKAADVALTALTDDPDAIKTFSGLSRQSVTQNRGIQIEGVQNSGPILIDVFNTVEELLRNGGIDTASQADRVFAVELAGDYKLAVVRIDNYRPITRAAFTQQAQSPSMLLEASRFAMPQGVESAMSLEALMKYTGFKLAEDVTLSNITGGDDDEELSDSDEAGDDAEGDEAE